MAANNNIFKMSNAGGFKSLTRYYDMLAGNTVWNPWEPAGAYESIAAITVPAAGATSITFSSIPASYAHLQLRCVLNNSNISTSMRFNSDTGANYADHLLYGDGTSALAAAVPNKTSLTFTQYSVAAASTFDASIIDILDYSNTSKNKTVRSLHGTDTNGAGFVALASGLWANTGAINTISIGVAGGAWTQYSQFALYGIKG